MKKMRITNQNRLKDLLRMLVFLKKKNNKLVVQSSSFITILFIAKNDEILRYFQSDYTYIVNINSLLLNLLIKEIISNYINLFKAL
jgi:hypothetical protein